MRRGVLLGVLMVVAGVAAALLSASTGGTVRAAAAPVIAHSAAPRAVLRAPTVPAAPGAQSCQVSGDCSIHPCVEFIGAASASTAPEIVGPGGARPAIPAGGRGCDPYPDRSMNSPSVVVVPRRRSVPAPRPIPFGRLRASPNPLIGLADRALAREMRHHR